MTKMEYAVLAATAVTVVNYLWLQAYALSDKSGRAVLWNSLPFFAWSSIILNILHQSKLTPSSHPYWAMEITLWTVAAAIAVATFNSMSNQKPSAADVDNDKSVGRIRIKNRDNLYSQDNPNPTNAHNSQLITSKNLIDNNRPEIYALINRRLSPGKSSPPRY